MRFETLARETAGQTGCDALPLHIAAADEYPILQARSRIINGSTAKRAMDIVIAAGLSLFLLPALIAIAAAIKFSSPGPILFMQLRYGAGMKPFWIYKFRTMRVQEAAGGFTQASRDDARVTPVGRWLRRSSLDELPQLINVLMGSMSLVGPRPHAISMDDYYREIIPDYSIRHLVRPGVTGLAQVRGFRGPTVKLDAIASRARCDAEYIRRWSLKLDIVLLLRTPGALFGPNAF